MAAPRVSFTAGEPKATERSSLLARSQSDSTALREMSKARPRLLRSKSVTTEELARPRDSLASKARPPLRKARSLLVELEDDTTSRAHEVHHARESQVVDTAGDARASVRFAGFLLAASLVLSGGFWISQESSWTLVDAVYLTVVTLTTVGYGDLAPRSEAERAFAVVLFFVGAGVVGALVGAAFEVLLAEAKLDAADAARAKAERRDRSRRAPADRLRRACATVLVWSLSGALVFMRLEGAGFLDALYWSGATLTTVGYGDVVPETQAGRGFAAFFCLGGSLVCVHALSTIAAVPLEAHRLDMETAVLGQYGDELTHEEYLELTRGELIRSLAIDADDGTCTKSTFALAMLVKLGKIDKDDVAKCCEQFDRLDHAKHGFLCRGDVASPRPLASSAWLKRLPDDGADDSDDATRSDDATAKSDGEAPGGLELLDTAASAATSPGLPALASPPSSPASASRRTSLARFRRAGVAVKVANRLRQKRRASLCSPEPERGDALV